MRAVLDSNVLARAVYSAGGPAEEAVFRLTAPPNVLIVSSYILEELRRVLLYPRLQRLHGFDNVRIEQAVAAIEAAATPVQIQEADVVKVVPHDPDDDHILAAAVAAKADVICTRNRHLFHEAVITYARAHSIIIMDDVKLLRVLRERELRSGNP